MKIAVIDPSLFTWPYDHALVEGLRDNGHTVSLFTKHLADEEPGKNASEIVEFFYPGLHSVWARKLPSLVLSMLKGLMHPVCLVILLRRLWRLRPDVIHFQWAPLPAVDRIFIPAFRRIAPTILTVHDSAPFNNDPRSIVQRIGVISIMKSFDRLIVHTNRARQRLISRGLPSAKVAIIPHGMLEPDTVHAVRPAAGNASDPVTLLLFGKIKPYKGTDVAIRALAAMPTESRARCRLRIVGKPYMDVEPLFALARELRVEPNIVWDLRFVSDDELSQIFSEADVMVMPYREIDASGVLMVALSIGIPVVASRIGLFAEMLEDGQHGHLVTPEDPAALAASLTSLADNAPERSRMSGNVRALRASIPDWRCIGEQTGALYTSILADARNASARLGHSTTWRRASEHDAD
jgi:glycosyltransferase involved in cell wall biosynthesis